jgi:sporulation protein YqfC
MNFFDNIVEELGVLKPTLEPCFRAMLIGDNLAYFENVRSIKSFSPTRVALLVKSGEVVIEGEDMYFKKYNSGDLVICGKINMIKRV